MAEEFVKTTTDPSSIGIGARPIGMGKAYVGLADDVSAVFLNPSGLAYQKNWQILSMSTKLLNEIDYLSLAATYNTAIGTFGIGFVSASIGGSFVTGQTLAEEGGIIFPIASEEAIDYTSTVLLLAYGNEAKKFYDHPWLENVSVGISFKLFSQGLSGGGIESGLMTGYDIDVGMMYKPYTWLSFGLNEVDALPASMGGKLTGGDTEVEHSLPSVTKLGMAFKVLGDDKSLYPYPQKLTYLLDFDYNATRLSMPMTYRTGVEWWPSDYLALRCGLDQDIVGKDTSSGFNIDTNLAAGAGVYYNGFKFDYAYHRYGTLSENDTQYLSLSYAAPTELFAPAVKEVASVEALKIFNPRDKTTTHDEAVDIVGKVADPAQISAVTVNGANVIFSREGSFEGTYPLTIGRNAFDIQAFANDGMVVDAKKIRVLRLVTFSDVPADYWARDAVEILATLGIISGFPDGTFKPDKTISRAELTTLLIKTRNPGTAEGVDTQFGDVKKNHWASFFIKSAADMKLITGYPDRTFKPSRPMNRAEGVMILTRFAGLKEPEVLLEGPFSDVPGRHWAAKGIMAARSAGLLVYLNEKPFEPSRALTRAEAAEMLSRTSFAVQKIDSLKDFDSY